jgi:hypothetical protein
VRSREREAALTQARASRAAATRPAAPRAATSRPAATRAPARQRGRAARRADSRWLPSEAVIGILLLLFGITVAVLVLTGTLKLAVAR